jgi:ABC-2 type transport system ATP-binding protein
MSVEPVVTIEAKGLQIRYGENDVLSRVNLQVARGEVVALLGPNGVGKTTTIEILEGFRMRSGGEVAVLGVDPARGSESWRARVGIVLQSWRDHGRWRVRELLAHLGSYYEPYSSSDRVRPIPVGELLSIVGLEAQADQQVRTLSGGQRRRLDLAVGIVGRPDALFLDEPTAGFDPHARREFHELIHRLSDRDETSILLTTHDLNEAERLADRILILVGGRIVADGSPEALARSVSGTAEVRWSVNGESYVYATEAPTAFVRQLFKEHGEGLAELDVRRQTLEETYFAMVRRHEAGHGVDAGPAFEEARA